MAVEPPNIDPGKGADDGADEIRVQTRSALRAPAALDETVGAEDFQAAQDGVDGNAVAVLPRPRQADLGGGHGASGLAGFVGDFSASRPLHHGVVAVLRQTVDDLLVVPALEVFRTKPADDHGVDLAALAAHLLLLVTAELAVEQGAALRCQLGILRVEGARRGRQCSRRLRALPAHPLPSIRSRSSRLRAGHVTLVVDAVATSPPAFSEILAHPA